MSKLRSQYEKEAKALRSRLRMKFLILCFLTLLGIIVSFWVGYYPLSPSQVANAFLSRFGVDTGVIPQAVTIFWNIRLPRILAALLIGAALSASGAVYQAMFQNPLVSPDILGVSSGAGMGAAFAIFLGLPSWGVQSSAFFFGILAVFFSWIISRKSPHSQTLTLVLTGTMIGSLCSAMITLLKYLADPGDVLQQLTFWLMGSLAKVQMEGIFFSFIPMAVGFLILFLLRWRINLLSLDDSEAQSLGISTKKYRLLLIAASTLLSAAAVCLGGLIGWVGLMIPHLCRALFGPDFEILLPASCLMGGLYLLLMDDLARGLFAMELPIGVVTAFFGAPFFISLIIKRREE